MIPQDVYAGLDVSQETTSICVVNSTGATVWRGRRSLLADAHLVRT